MMAYPMMVSVGVLASIAVYVAWAWMLFGGLMPPPGRRPLDLRTWLGWLAGFLAAYATLYYTPLLIYGFTHGPEPPAPFEDPWATAWLAVTLSWLLLAYFTLKGYMPNC